MFAIVAFERVLPLNVVKVQAQDFSPISFFFFDKVVYYIFFQKKFGYIKMPSLSCLVYFFLHLLSNKWESGPNSVWGSAWTLPGFPIMIQLDV